MASEKESKSATKSRRKHALASSTDTHASNSHSVLEHNLSLNGSVGTEADPETIKAREKEVVEKIKELVRLAQEQGYVTYNDINEALPDAMLNPETLDEIYIKLRGLEVEIV